MSKDCKKIIDKVGEEMRQVYDKEDRKIYLQKAADRLYQMYLKTKDIKQLLMSQEMLTKAIAL